MHANTLASAALSVPHKPQWVIQDSNPADYPRPSMTALRVKGSLLPLFLLICIYVCPCMNAATLYLKCVCVCIMESLLNSCLDKPNFLLHHLYTRRNVATRGLQTQLGGNSLHALPRNVHSVGLPSTSHCRPSIPGTVRKYTQEMQISMS